MRSARETAGRAVWPVEAIPITRPAPTVSARLPERISASQCQSLVDCAYQFFARSLLRLRPLDEVTEEPDQRDYGEAVHAVLARFHREWGDATLHDQPRDRLAASLAAHAAAIFDPLVERLPRFLTLRQQFADAQSDYLDWTLRRSVDGWRFFEAESRHTATLALGASSQTIALMGRIDRLDRRGDEFELLDYKARRRSPLAERLAAAGEDVQLPFYGLLLSQRAASAAYVVLQRHTERDPSVAEVRAPQPFTALADAVQERLRNDLQRVAAGHALSAIGAESVCRYCEMRGLCRRDYWQEPAA
jgi:ATP-dependent helicase/nuclease subunit B